MPFSMKILPATFQQMINRVIDGLEGCEGYIDDIIMFSNTLEQHLLRVEAFLSQLRQARLTVNLSKSYLDRHVSPCCGSRKDPTHQCQDRSCCYFSHTHQQESTNEIFWDTTLSFAETLQLLLNPWHNFYRRNRLQQISKQHLKTLKDYSLQHQYLWCLIWSAIYYPCWR